MAGDGVGDPGIGWEPWAVGRIQAIVATLIGAIATLTFVAFAGAAVLWARAFWLGLPPDAIVSVVPKAELVATGASTLTGFALLGLLAAGVLYVIDPYGVPSLATRIGLAALVAVELGIALYYADPGVVQLIGGAVAYALALAGVVVASTLLQEDAAAPAAPAPPEEVAPADDLSGLVDSVLEGVRSWGATTSARVPAAPAPVMPPRLKWEGQLTILGLIVAAIVGSQLLYGRWWLTATVATALGLYVIVLAIARSSGARFAATGVAAFASVAVFGAALAGLRFSETEQVQPIAALRTGEGAPVCGIFIAEAGDRLYMARLDRDRAKQGPTVDGATGHLFWLERKAVTGWALGTLQNQVDAQQALGRLAARVVEERRTVTTHTHIEERKAATPTKIEHSGKKTITVVPGAGRKAPICSIYAV